MNLTINKRQFKRYDTVYVQDFNDDYHQDKTKEDELSRRVREIVSMYSDVKLFNMYMEIYNDYMEMLYAKYGGRTMFECIRKNAGVDEYIPPTPTLKTNSESLRDYIKLGIKNSGMLKKVSFSKKQQIMKKVSELTDEMLQYEADKLGVHPDDLEIIVIFENESRNKIGDESLLKGLQKVLKTEAKSSMVKSSENLITSFYSKVQSTDNNNTLINPENFPSPSEFLTGDYDKELFDESEETKKSQMLNVGGRYYSRAQIEEEKIISSLEGLGWDTKYLKFISNKSKYENDKIISDIIKNGQKDKKEERLQESYEVMHNTIDMAIQQASDIEVDSWDDFEGKVFDCFTVQ